MDYNIDYGKTEKEFSEELRRLIENLLQFKLGLTSQ